MKKIINTKKAPAAIGPYVQAVSANGFLFTSGQLGIDPLTGHLPEGIDSQARRSLENLKEILAQEGLTLDDVVKTTVFVKDLADFAAINAIYQDAFGVNFLARSCVQVAALPAGGLVEIEVIACLK